MVARAQIQERRALVREQVGAYSMALRETTRGRKLAAVVDSAESHAVQARLLALAAVVRARQKQADRARRTGLEAAELAERCSERKALALYEELGDLEGQAAMANNLGVIAYFEGRWDETVDRYRQAAESDRRFGRLLEVGDERGEHRRGAGEPRSSRGGRATASRLGAGAPCGQSILIRGGTSSVGMATAVLAKRIGMTVLSTTRTSARTDSLRSIGVDHPLIDDGNVATQVRELLPEGVDTALELVGTPTLPDTLAATKVHGVVCFTGMLSNEWTIPDFYPIEYLPRGVRLTAYGGDANDLPAHVLQDFLDAVAAGDAHVPIHRTYRMNDISQAHADMEAGTATGKLVVLP